ncbi:paraquat-inducible protein A [Pseudomonas asuensis]|nr:paraquat-inducible protein A [Pseudomonas asuensis]
MSDLPNSHQSHDLSAIIACPECDLLMQKVTLDYEYRMSCSGCGYELFYYKKHVVNKGLALVFSALLLFIPANFLPIMKLKMFGQQTHDTVWGAVMALYRADMTVIASLVLLCSFCIPLFKLLCQLSVLISLKWPAIKAIGILALRCYQHLREWGMWEIYLLGILVAMVKVGDVAELSLGMGLFCFVALLLIQIWLDSLISPQQLWQEMEWESDHASD